MTTTRADALRGHAAMLAFALLVAGSFSLGGLAAPHMDPAALNAVRFALATGIMAGLAAGRLRREHLCAPWRYALLGGLLAIYFVLMFVALRIADPVATGAVFTLTPALSALFGWALLGQVPTTRIVLALILAAVGAIWVIFRADLPAVLAFQIGRGEAIFFVGCAAHALYTPLVRRLNRGEPVLVFTTLTLAAAFAVLAAWGARALVATDLAALPGIVWVTILYTAVVATAVTFFLLQFASLRLPSSKVMAYTYLVPSVVMLWEGALGHGWVAAPVLLGTAATLGALVLLVKD